MFIGYRGKQILFIMDTECLPSSDYDILEFDISDRTILPSDIIKNYEVWRHTVIDRSSVRPCEQLRIALVGVYRIQCGISTYAEQLFPRLAAKVSECRIFAEHTDTAVPDESGVVRCWRRGEPLTDLVRQIRDFCPDVVYVEHEFGIFPNARYWLSFVAQMQEYRLFVKQHSVFYHKDKLVCEACVPEIIVHTEIGRKVLKEKGVTANVHVISHGCTPCTESKRFWNLYHSPHTIVQFGFGFEYKGWETALRSIAILKPTFPDVFYTGLFSESKFNKLLHQNYYNKLNALIQELGIESNVAIIRGYQSDQSLEAYLRTNQIAIFPYVMNGEHTVYGATGATRLAMTQGIPTIVSDVPQFDDMDGICPRPANSAELAQEIETFFNSKNVREKQIERQNKFLLDNSWENVTQQHLDLFSSGIPAS